MLCHIANVIEKVCDTVCQKLSVKLYYLHGTSVRFCL